MSRRVIIRCSQFFIFIFLLGMAPLPAVSNSPGALLLKAPPFLNVAYAQEQDVQPAAVAAIADEAGIAAYFDRGGAITLSQVRQVYRTIESETADYIIGSVEVKTTDYAYPESEDVHVYVSAAGWVMAYYLKADPTAKIFDTAGFSSSSGVYTKLEIALNRVATVIGIGNSPASTFYHFNFPNATHLMLIGERTDVSPDTFTVELPLSFTFYERSWILWTNYDCCSDGIYKLNDNSVAVVKVTGEGKYGTLTDQILPRGTTHTISIEDGNHDHTRYWTVGGLALVHKESQ